MIRRRFRWSDRRFYGAISVVSREAEGPSRHGGVCGLSKGRHPAALMPAQLLAECEQRCQRRSGPGGQHRNKVETAVTITHRPTGIRGEASERRSQEANRRQALRRLRVKLALQVRRPVDTTTTPSPLWQSRARDGRLRVRADHDDFPTLLAEALDWIQKFDGDVAHVAARLGVTASQLLRLLRQQPEALSLVNRHRRQQGLRPLR